MTAALVDQLLELPGLPAETQAALDRDGRTVVDMWRRLPAAERQQLTRLADQFEATP